MLVLITYDVSTVTPAGRRRLSRVARACSNMGVRVQNSVFECEVDSAQLATLEHRIADIIDTETDSVRYYLLGRKGRRRVIHVGAKPGVDVAGPLVI